MRTRRLHDYIDDVVAALRDEFEWEPLTAEIATRTLRSYPNGFAGSRLEFICDHPGAANARLKADQHRGPWALRVADYRYGARDDSRLAGINDTLDRLHEQHITARMTRRAQR